LYKELDDANIQLKELDRQKDELLSIVSHQLATPVSSIKWNLEMLVDGDMGKLNDKQMETMLSLQSVSADLSDLISMILDVSRIQLGKMKMDKQELDLQEFFKEIMDVIGPKAKEKTVQLVAALPSNFPKAMLDKRYTRMTIENLLSNAVKYTPTGGRVNFTVEVKGNTLHCKVQDTGVGIPKNDQDKIFGKLFRATNVRNTVDGNGFGLYVAKGAIEAQGGKIWFESEEGKGTTFFVELPLQ
jgi:signal transduction histidine kinase